MSSASVKYTKGLDMAPTTRRRTAGQVSGESIVIEAAWMYYHDGLNQNQIAQMLKVSRATVVNYLAEARERGYIRIDLSPDVFTGHQLAQDLRERFGLKAAFVVPSGLVGEEDSLMRVARAASSRSKSRFSAPMAVLVWRSSSRNWETSSINAINAARTRGVTSTSGIPIIAVLSAICRPALAGALAPARAALRERTGEVAFVLSIFMRCRSFYATTKKTYFSMVNKACITACVTIRDHQEMLPT